MTIRDRKFVDVGGVRTGYFEQGQGDVIVLFHGGGFSSLPRAAHSAQDWDLNIEGLSQWFHVYAVDKLGHGYTGNPKSLDGYSREAQIQHAAEFLKTLELRDVTLVGHSQGGILVTRLALQHSEQIRSCIIVDSGSLAPGLTRGFGEAPEPRLSKESQRWVLQKYSFSFDHISDEFLEAMCAIAMQPKYQEAVATLQKTGLIRTHIQPQMMAQKEETLRWLQEGRLKIPTLLLWGYNDPTAPLSKGHALFELVAHSAPRSQMHIFNQAGHFSYREHPKEFNEVVRGFIQ